MEEGKTYTQTFRNGEGVLGTIDKDGQFVPVASQETPKLAPTDMPAENIKPSDDEAQP